MANKWKRLVALVLVLTMSMSMCLEGAYALDEPVTGEEPGTQVVSEEPGQEEQTPSEETEAPEEGTVSDGEAAPTEMPAEEPDPEAPAEEPADSGAVVAEPDEEETPAEEPLEEEPQEEAAVPALAYLVVSQPELSTPDTQKILVGIGSEQVVLDAAIITVHNESTGEYLDYAASTLTGGAALFEITYSDGQSGAYTLSSLRYTYNGVETELNFAEIGIEARYGVNTEVTTNPDDVVVPEDEAEAAQSGAGVDLEVSTINEYGELEAADSIEDAMAAGDSLESGIMTMALDDDSAGANGRATSKTGNIVVVLDPGHDSTHAGAQANGLSEEDLTLKIAQYCRTELETYAGVTVYMTRESADCPYPGTTSTQDNAKRVEYAASVNADYYVSIHINSFPDSSANGAEVYYPNENYATNATNSAVNSGINLNVEGKALAQSIMNQLVALGILIHGDGVQIKNSGDNTLYPDNSLADYYGVIKRSKEAGFCGIIVEHCYITNSSDVNNYLSSNAKLKSLGVADATGIATYLGLSKGTSSKVGWQQVGSNWYYYSSSGVKHTGWLQIGPYWYYLDPSSGKMLTGWQKIDGDWYYLEPAGGVMLTGWIQLGNYRYYLNSSGRLQTGWQKINGAWYYLEPSGGVMKTGWIYIGRTWYFLDNSGVMQTGWLQRGQYRYYLDPDGRMLIGWQLIDGFWYYFEKSGGVMLTGWLQIGQYRYYLNSDGKMLTGWQLIDGSWYYFEKSGGVMLTGWLQIGQYRYYLNSDGKMLTGWQKINGSWYYFETAGGVMLTGWIQLGKTWYFLDNSGVMQTGWLQRGQYRYYLDSDGRMLIGWQKINGSWYYFETAGGVMMTGWLEVGIYHYYLAADGKMVTGWQEINGSWYYFETAGGVMMTGWLTLGSNTYYLKASGVRATNETLEINGTSYYFDENGLLKSLVPYSATINANSQTIWNFLISKGLTPAGAAGLMGNLDAESSMNPTNLEGYFEKQLFQIDENGNAVLDSNGNKIYYTDATYTAAVDNGTYRYAQYNNARDSFTYDYVGSTSNNKGAGYGLAQWTWWSQKQALYDYAKSKNTSIGDLQTQLEFLTDQLQTPEFRNTVWNVLTTTDDILEASNAVLLNFERPADQGGTVQLKRAGKGLTYYQTYYGPYNH